MKLIFIRHAEPDYENNTLTEKGFKEAEALGLFYKDLKVDAIYSSPLNRAYFTCEAFAKYHPEIEIQKVDELVEFNHEARFYPPYDKENAHVTWDFLPRYFVERKEMLSINEYLDSKWFENTTVKEAYLKDVKVFDDILEKHGYKRSEKGYYEAIKANKDTVVFVTHLGKMAVLLSHILHIPHVLIAQYFCALPSSVTVVVTEEREEKIAQFRCLRFGDLSHLAVANIDESFMARWAETFDSKERH